MFEDEDVFGEISSNFVSVNTRFFCFSCDFVYDKRKAKESTNLKKLKKEEQEMQRD
jgi:hypothetical protein